MSIVDPSSPRLPSVLAVLRGGLAVSRVLPWIGLAALTYGGYYYYQEQQQQQQQGRAAGPNIFLGGQGPRPAKGQDPPGASPTPAEAALPGEPFFGPLDR